MQCRSALIISSVEHFVDAPSDHQLFGNVFQRQQPASADRTRFLRRSFANELADLL